MLWNQEGKQTTQVFCDTITLMKKKPKGSYDCRFDLNNNCKVVHSKYVIVGINCNAVEPHVNNGKRKSA